MALVAKIDLTITLIPDYEEDDPDVLRAEIEQEMRAVAAQYGDIKVTISLGEEVVPKVRRRAKQPA